jgi:hypothetical protein
MTDALAATVSIGQRMYVYRHARRTANLALATTGCTAQAGDETELDEPLDSVATESSEYTIANRTIPWRGAARQGNAKSSARFGQIDAVYAADIKYETVCLTGDDCSQWIKGMKVFMHDEEDNTTHQGPIGLPNSAKTTRQVCPSNAPYVTGYRLNVGSGAGFTKVEGFGLITWRSPSVTRASFR